MLGFVLEVHRPVERVLSAHWESDVIFYEMTSFQPFAKTEKYSFLLFQNSAVNISW